MAAYRRVDNLRSPAGWLPVHRDQLRAQRSVSSMGKPLPLPFTVIQLLLLLLLLPLLLLLLLLLLLRVWARHVVVDGCASGEDHHWWAVFSWWTVSWWQRSVYCWRLSMLTALLSLTRQRLAMSSVSLRLPCTAASHYDINIVRRRSV